MRKLKVLILCTGNSARSQIAESLLRYFVSDRLEVFSAGIEPNSEINPLAIEIMNEIGIDISKQVPRHVKEFLNQDFDFVITTCNNAKKVCPVFPKKTKNIHWNIEDPALAKGTKEEQLKVFRKVRDLIYKKIQDFLKEYIEND